VRGFDGQGYVDMVLTVVASGRGPKVPIVGEVCQNGGRERD